MTILGIFAIGFSAACALGAGTLTAKATAEATGLNKDINDIKAARALDDEFDDDEDDDDILVEMASQNRSEAADPQQ